MYRRPVQTVLSPELSLALEKDLGQLEALLAALKRLEALTPELETFRQAHWPAGRELFLAVASTNELNSDARPEQETS